MILGEKTSFDFSIPDGEYVVKVGEPVFTADENEQATNTLRIPFEIADGEYAGGKVSMFCPLDKGFGRKKMASVLGYTGIAQKLEEKFKLDPNLTIEKWADKYLDITNDKCRKVINQAIVLLPGNSLIVTLKTREYKDRDGNERTIQDVANVTYAQTKSKSTKSPTKPTTTADDVIVKEDDDEDTWD